MIEEEILKRAGLLLIATLAIACTANREDQGNHLEVGSDSTRNWVAMDEFHLVMAECFHPFKDSANLEPARNNAEAMASVAQKWMNSTLPTQVDNEVIKAKLRRLTQEADAFVEKTRTGDDAAIGESLTTLHDIFHGLQEAWYARQPEEH